MLNNDYLNKMTEDELRNYAAHMNTIVENYEPLRLSMSRMIDVLNELYVVQADMYKTRIRLNYHMDGLAPFDDNIRSKYSPSFKDSGEVNYVDTDTEQAEDNKQ